MNITIILVILVAVGAAGTGGSLYFLLKEHEKNGALQQSLNTATERLKEINNVHKEMDKVHSTNNALPDDKLFDGLLPTAPGN